MKKEIYTVEIEEQGERLDVFIAKKSGLSRSYIQRLIKDRAVLVNSMPARVSYKIRQGDRIELTISDKPSTTLIPEDIPLEVIFNDPHIIVINKPHGMVVYPSAGHMKGTLMNALIARGERLALTGAPLRPGVVHRLDKDTSGIIMIAKDDTAYLNLLKQFQMREVEKHYLALVYGVLKEKRGEIRTVIGRSVSDRKKMSTRTKKGKEAITQYKVIREFNIASLVKVRLITGRTHQIRVHFASIGHPVLGDRTYGRKCLIKIGEKEIRFTRQMLHAFSLRFRHPVTEEKIELTAPMPEDMELALNLLHCL